MSTQTDLARGGSDSFDATDDTLTPQTTLSDPIYPLQRPYPATPLCSWPTDPTRASGDPPSVILEDGHTQELTTNRPPFDTCSIFPGTKPYAAAPCSDFLKIIRGILPEPSKTEPVPAKSQTQRASVADLEDTFYSILSDELDPTPLPGTTDKLSRFFIDGKARFYPAKPPDQQPSHLSTGPGRKPCLIRSVAPLDDNGNRQLSSLLHQGNNPWELTPKETEVLDQWKQDWHTRSRAHELVSDDFLGQEWIEDERIWAELGLGCNTAEEQPESQVDLRALRDDQSKGNRVRKSKEKGEKVKRGEAVEDWVMVKRNDGWGFPM